MNVIRSIYHRARLSRMRLLQRVYRLQGKLAPRLSGRTVQWPHTAVATIPVRIDGTGHVSLGEAVALGYPPAPRAGSGEILLQARGKSSITIGPRTALSNNVSIISMLKIELGADCLIGDGVSIYDCDFHEIPPATRLRSFGKTAAVVIGNNVWLGSRVLVLKGVTIGDNTVIAAGAVVTKSLPANILAGGIPATVIRSISGSED